MLLGLLFHVCFTPPPLDKICFAVGERQIVIDKENTDRRFREMTEENAKLQSRLEPLEQPEVLCRHV